MKNQLITIKQLRKGFTLIELLAVIVILSIILVITTPVVIKTMEGAKEGAFKNAVHGIVRSAEIEYSQQKLNGSIDGELIYTFANNEQSSNIEGHKLKFKGTPPKNGQVIVNKMGEVSLVLHNGTWCAIKDFDDSKITLDKITKEDCLSKIEMEDDSSGTLTDSRDGKTYPWVKIGDQVWMAENLKYTGNGCLSKTYNSSSPYDACLANGAEIHYQWGAAMDGSTTEGARGICPTGWHLPTDEEWKILEGTVDTTYKVGSSEWDKSSTWRGSDVGKKLKGTAGGGTNDFGFRGLLSGSRNTSGTLYDVGANSFWWSSSPSGTNAWYRYVYLSNDTVSRSTGSQAYGFSVRCVRD